MRIAKLSADVGFPPGVINIVPGRGGVAGQHLAEHMGVDKIAFTGSTPVGRKIVQASSTNLKRVQLELGGKGANIVFEDAPIDAAVGGSAFAIFHNQGQACIAGSRLLLHEKIADQFLEKFLKLAKSIKLGNPLDPQTEMGPLTSAGHRDKVLSYVDVAKQEGGNILTGGKPPANPDLAKGYYVEPTIVEAKPSDRVCQEEVFGARTVWPRRFAPVWCG
jgi:aldehyde dehydrogenase (NAD+)/betaine-aldehyde dehydrogenase